MLGSSQKILTDNWSSSKYETKKSSKYCLNSWFSGFSIFNTALWVSTTAPLASLIVAVA